MKKQPRTMPGSAAMPPTPSTPTSTLLESLANIADRLTAAENSVSTIRTKLGFSFSNPQLQEPDGILTFAMNLHQRAVLLASDIDAINNAI